MKTLITPLIYSILYFIFFFINAARSFTMLDLMWLATNYFRLLVIVIKTLFFYYLSRYRSNHVVLKRHFPTAHNSNPSYVLHCHPPQSTAMLSETALSACKYAPNFNPNFRMLTSRIFNIHQLCLTGQVSTEADENIISFEERYWIYYSSFQVNCELWKHNS